MENPRPSAWLRFVTLFVIVLNAGFGYVYPMLPLGLEDMRTASDHYPNLFTPAPYAFAIWGLIYGSWIVYTLYSLTPGQRRNALHDRLCKPLILINVLASVWIIEFAAGFLFLSLLVIGMMLGAGVWVFRRARNGTRSGWLRFPFSLFLGWITVATLANLNALLASNDWHGGRLGEPVWTLMLIAVALLAGLIVSLRARDAIYPLVVAWAVTAIGVKLRLPEPGVSMGAFLSAAALVIVAVVAAFRGPRDARGYFPN